MINGVSKKRTIDAPSAGSSPTTRALASTPEQADMDTVYDILPYPSMPVAHTQPANLAAIAALFGVAAPMVSTARVLDLGCAAGGNIIPLATRFPDATFLGVDLVSRHIEDGNRRIALLGLKNIQLWRNDLSKLNLEGEQYDFIICHGVYSWVPREVQDAILRLCQTALAPNGIAAISYNVMPGWHLRTVIRDLCLYYAGNDNAPRRRVAKARWALEQIARRPPSQDPYGTLLRTEATRLRQMPASYIHSEFLAPHNSPCYVTDFIERAEQFGLGYLCEADLSASVPQTLDPKTRGRISAFAGASDAATEQHIDFLTGRQFRCSVLVRWPKSVQPYHRPHPKRLRQLHVSSPLHFDRKLSTESLAVFRDVRGREITTGDAVVRDALVRIARAYPGSLTLDQLIVQEGDDDDRRAKAESRVLEVLFNLVIAGQASISVVPQASGRADDRFPKAWFLARLEADAGQPWLTSLRHIGVPVSPILKALLPHLDGTHERPALEMRLRLAIESGEVNVAELPVAQTMASEEEPAALVPKLVEWALQHLARQALLE